jgi:hypothetical protein
MDGPVGSGQPCLQPHAGDAGPAAAVSEESGEPPALTACPVPQVAGTRAAGGSPVLVPPDQGAH